MAMTKRADGRYQKKIILSNGKQKIVYGKSPAAVNAAVNAFNRELLAEHLRTCVARDLKEGHEEIVDELAATLQKLMK
mgnify:CR=1 FL=1